MKRFLLLYSLFFVCHIIFAQTGYRYKGQFIELKTENTSYSFVMVNSSEAVALRNSISDYTEIRENCFIVKKEHRSNIDAINYESNIYTYNNGSVIVLPKIIFCVKDYFSLENIEQYDVSIEKINGNKYVLKCNVSHSQEVLSIVDGISKMECVLWCEPDMLSGYRLSNTLYNQQYYLKNTGQNGGTVGIDINVEPAWNLTNGNGVTIAVLDEGVDQYHEDFGNRILNGYTIGDNNGIGEPKNYDTTLDGCKGHGVACTGILAAENNNIGIRGIASSAQILPVNIAPNVINENIGYYGMGTTSEIADAINWAWKRADVLSCSWGGSYPSQEISDAIDSATTFGRNGKGTIVVVASGNGYPLMWNVSFPANLDNVIAVGAIDKNGYIWNYSQRGPSMDLVAPTGDAGYAGDVITTDRMGSYGYNTSASNGNYTDIFGGTSAACPQVAGIAALVLSVNPNLNEFQVRHILRITARDLGDPGFDNVYGYGLVDAYAAVMMASPTLFIRDTVTDNGAIPSAVYFAHNSPDIWTTDMENNPCNPKGGELCKVCVRIHNGSNSASSGNEKLIVNWAKAGMGLPWDYGWLGNNYFAPGVPCSGFVTNASGITIPSIPAGESIVLKITWLAPDPAVYANIMPVEDADWWHFCLAARVHDGTPIVGENSHLLNMGTFTRNNDNVAWKNISIISENCNGAVISSSNAMENITNCNIDICEVTDGNGNTPSVTDYAEVYITLDAGLLAAINSNASIIGLDWISSNTLRWNGGSASIPVTLPANSNYTLKTTVNFIADQIPATNNFNFDIVMRNPTGDTVLGGEHYQCIRTNGRWFEANITYNTNVLLGDPVTLVADDINEDADYQWYDEQGNSIGNGLTCIVYPQQTTSYTLRVTADADGYRAYRTVSVLVTDGELRLLAPNPADNQVRIGYALSRNISAATLQILNGSGQVVYTQALSGGNGSKVTGETLVNTSSMAAGSYTVRLVTSNGKVHDSRTLVVR